MHLAIFGIIRVFQAKTIQVDTAWCKFSAKRGLAQLLVSSSIAIAAASLSTYEPLASAVLFIVAAITSRQYEFAAIYCVAVNLVVDWGLYRYILLVVPVSVIGIQFIGSMVRLPVVDTPVVDTPVVDTPVVDTPVVARTVDLVISVDRPATE